MYVKKNIRFREIRSMNFVQSNRMKSEFYYDRSNDFASPDIISRKFECNLSNPIDSNKVRKRGPLQLAGQVSPNHSGFNKRCKFSCNRRVIINYGQLEQIDMCCCPNIEVTVFLSRYRTRGTMYLGELRADIVVYLMI